ncbi:hypothetical protein Pan153_04500 [Gimesia panareensis]|uniref:Uncharacterized protein n=1 Tax=Gimesia panareensis TaxID=2527978 RepID=A0A518FHL2_9PLAN|nr:hypothetical protein [Gimesia panareensis]QDV15831.1 hypothetical protein Pan153_04500 [Gimesia panareensis]
MPANANLINVVILLAVMFICYLFVLIPILIYYAIQHMRSPQLILLSEEEAVDYYDGKCRVESDWARSRQFAEAGVFRRQQNFILVWEHVDSATFFQVTLSPYGRIHHFTTVFEDDYSLLTANDRESLIFPLPPRRFVQSFGIEQLELLHEKHQAGVADLLRLKHLELCRELPEFEESYLASMQQQHDHVRSVFFYPIRGIWWYHIDRRAKFNRPIDLQQAVLDN